MLRKQEWLYASGNMNLNSSLASIFKVIQISYTKIYKDIQKG